MPAQCAARYGCSVPDINPVETAANLRLVLGQLVRRVRAESGVSFGHLAVLGLLDRDGPQTTTQLAAARLVRHQSMTRTVDQLTAACWVAKAQDPTDGRKVRLRITKAGQVVLQQERARRVDWLANAIEGQLSKGEQRILAQAIPVLTRLARDG